ncbi:hypothetical protein H9P43_002567 [Blastocladiella emersonii ATCC 22665]|nr:hypothetical protein H9P43_002567 [Blastocladiella emersonii ATCC 22665]
MADLSLAASAELCAPEVPATISVVHTPSLVAVGSSGSRASSTEHSPVRQRQRMRLSRDMDPADADTESALPPRAASTTPTLRSIQQIMNRFSAACAKYDAAVERIMSPSALDLPPSNPASSLCSSPLVEMTCETTASCELSSAPSSSATPRRRPVDLHLEHAEARGRPGATDSPLPTPLLTPTLPLSHVTPEADRASGDLATAPPARCDTPSPRSTHNRTYTMDADGDTDMLDSEDAMDADSEDNGGGENHHHHHHHYHQHLATVPALPPSPPAPTHEPSFMTTLAQRQAAAAASAPQPLPLPPRSGDSAASGIDSDSDMDSHDEYDHHHGHGHAHAHGSGRFNTHQYAGGDHCDLEDALGADGRPHPDDDDWDHDTIDFMASVPPLSLLYGQREEPLLPPIMPGRTHTLVLDLDETLLHCTTVPIPNPGLAFSVDFNGTRFDIYGNLRPGVRRFLRRVSRAYEVVIFTASQQVYAERVLQALDPDQKYIRHVLHRDHCVPILGNYLKDLSSLGRDLRTTIIVDNAPQAFAYHPANGLPIRSWYDDPHDRALARLSRRLLALAQLPDVRPAIRTLSLVHARLEGVARASGRMPVGLAMAYDASAADAAALEPHGTGMDLDHPPMSPTGSVASSTASTMRSIVSEAASASSAWSRYPLPAAAYPQLWMPPAELPVQVQVALGVLAAAAAASGTDMSATIPGAGGVAAHEHQHQQEQQQQPSFDEEVSLDSRAPSPWVNSLHLPHLAGSPAAEASSGGECEMVTGVAEEPSLSAFADLDAEVAAVTTASSPAVIPPKSPLLPSPPTPGIADRRGTNVSRPLRLSPTPPSPAVGVHASPALSAQDPGAACHATVSAGIDAGCPAHTTYALAVTPSSPVLCPPDLVAAVTSAASSPATMAVPEWAVAGLGAAMAAAAASVSASSVATSSPLPTPVTPSFPGAATDLSSAPPSTLRTGATHASRPTTPAAAGLGADTPSRATVAPPPAPPRPPRVAGGLSRPSSRLSTSASPFRSKEAAAVDEMMVVVSAAAETSAAAAAAAAAARGDGGVSPASEAVLAVSE